MIHIKDFCCKFCGKQGQFSYWSDGESMKTGEDVERVEQHMTLQGMERQGLHNTAFGIIRDDTARFSVSLKEKAGRYLENLLISATDDLAVKG